MSHDVETDESADDRLEQLNRARNEAIEACRYRTAVRLATEMRRLAKAEHRLDQYIQALHTLTNSASDLLDPEQGRESAVELIAVLESEDRARQVQPDVDLAEYEWYISRVSSCAYDNLAKATALGRGYNSEGVHGTLGEGIQICRRTGKLECITCFREYAVDVALAADDVEMALHHARHVAAHGNARPGFDRRWSGANDEIRIQFLAGRLEAAEAAARRALELAGTYHSPLRARLLTLDRLETVMLLKGEDGLPPDIEGLGMGTAAPPAGEFPWGDLHGDLREALRSCCRGDHDAAIRRLAEWDRRLLERQCTELWFEVRLRLIAAHRLAGGADRVAALARPLESKAREAADWLTLRRLARLLDPSEPASPIAAAAPLSAGPFASAVAAPPVEGVPPAGVPGEPGPEEPAPTPLEAELRALGGRLAGAPDDPAVRASVLSDLLAIPADSVRHPADAARLLHLAWFVADDPARGPAVWEWAEAVAAAFAREAVVPNLLATLGARLRGDGDTPAAERITADRVAALYRASLDLDPADAGNHARAGLYFAEAGDQEHAERCLARSFRLARENPGVALRLAEIYATTDRPADALAVLDMCLREGGDAPEVAWQAATLAHASEQYEVMLTYLDRFESLIPDRPWTNYYRASGLLWLDRPEEALAALDEEQRRTEGGTLHIQILRACASAALGRLDDLRRELGRVLEVRLSSVDELTHTGLIQLFGRLWAAAATLPDDDPLRRAAEARLVETGLAPDMLFDGPRRKNPKAEGIGAYACALLQPLDDRWRDSPGCLAGEQDWTAYRIAWGVLARDEDEAAREALAWQARCAPLRATVEEVQLQQEGFTDHPGVVWQGVRSGQVG